jgi:hypothetical protein
MKRLLLVIVLCVLIATVSATPIISEDFQDGAANAFTQQLGSVSATVTNSNEDYYLAVTATDTSQYGYYGVIVASTSPGATYWAYTSRGGATQGAEVITWYDSAGNLIAGRELGNAGSTYTKITSALIPDNTRIEFKLIGGDILWYSNGVYQGIAVDHTVWSGVAPSYWGIGAHSWSYSARTFYFDDVMAGADYTVTSDHKMLDTPPGNWLLVRDPTTHVYGVVNGAGAQVRTYPFYGRYAKQDATTPQVINFLNTEGAIIDTTTVTAMAGTVTWNNSLLYTNTSPYGLCRMQFAEGLPVGYIGSTVANSTAVSLTFNMDTYSQGDTATLTHSIASAYWNPTDYDYHIAVVDIYGAFVGSNITVSTSSGDSSLIFTSTDFPPMVYYAELFRVNKLTGEEQFLAYDNAAVSAYIPVSGHVYDGNTTLPLSGVLYNISQLSTWSNGTSGTDGNFSSSNWLTGSQIHYYFTKAGYTSFNYSFTPLSARNVSLNISLCPSSPLTSGRAIGGIARETAYGSYIPQATVIVSNSTSGESYTNLTNIRGYYKCDVGYQCYATLTPARMYSVQGSKNGFNTSQVYNVVVS